MWRTETTPLHCPSQQSHALKCGICWPAANAVRCAPHGTKTDARGKCLQNSPASRFLWEAITPRRHLRHCCADQPEYQSDHALQEEEQKHVLDKLPQEDS